MIKRSFFGLLKPRLEYDVIKASLPEPQEISPSKKVQLFANATFDQTDQVLLKPGDNVKTGQKLLLFENEDDYSISGVTGRIAGVSLHAGDFGQEMTSVFIDVANIDENDTQFKETIESPSMENVKNFLGCLPGNLPVSLFSDPKKPINTILIMGIDADLLINTQQYIVRSHSKSIRKGISILKEITGVNKFVMAVTDGLVQDATTTGATVKTVSSTYPEASPYLILKDVMGKEVPAGKSFEELGIAVLSAEAVASLGTAYETGQIPSKKILTVIDKSGTKKMVSAIIGTPLSDIFNGLKISADESDRIIIGGPMMGASVYTEDYPVSTDTDAVIIQEKNIIPMVSDNACINCGECVRICPVNVPVNLLVRFLEAGEYQDAADNYDLYSCIECGLCSYVCTAKMPVFQYIRLGKYELARIYAAEAEEND